VIWARLSQASCVCECVCVCVCVCVRVTGDERVAWWHPNSRDVTATWHNDDSARLWSYWTREAHLVFMPVSNATRRLCTTSLSQLAMGNTHHVLFTRLWVSWFHCWHSTRCTTCLFSDKCPARHQAYFIMFLSARRYVKTRLSTYPRMSLPQYVCKETINGKKSLCQLWSCGLYRQSLYI